MVSNLLAFLSNQFWSGTLARRLNSTKKSDNIRDIINSQDDNAEEGVDWKMKMYYYLKFREWVDVFTVSFRSMLILVISRCCLAVDGYEMYKGLKRTCWANVLPIKAFVLPRPRCRCRRGSLKSHFKMLQSLIILTYNRTNCFIIGQDETRNITAEHKMAIKRR